jgi:hypothetical protein
MSSERRQHERFELLAQVELSRSGRSETLVTINISAGGILLRNDRNAEFGVGESIRVRFDVPSAFVMEATIIRIIAATAKPPALAAMWTSSDAQANASLAQLLWTLKAT